MQLHVVKKNETARPFEIVERKGSGHPDTLADSLAEELSVMYSNYTLERYGAILHHAFDKVGIMGGTCDVKLGSGKITSPIRVLINGRASSHFADEQIPVREMLTETTLRFFAKRFPMLDVEQDLRIMYEVSQGASPGDVGSTSVRKRWFQPQSLADLPELETLRCNDTSLGAAFAPMSELERLVLDVETRLNSDAYRADHPWIGNDIKIMGQRAGNIANITLCVPQLSQVVSSVAEYRENLETARAEIQAICAATHPELRLEIHLNTRDKPDSSELYLTFTGSSIETGDEGFVGRGNRMGGLITPSRQYTMEGIGGKNPVYHTGKLYCVGAYEIAQRLHTQFGVESEVFLVGQSGRPLADPWIAAVTTASDVAASDAEAVVADVLGNADQLTKSILTGDYRLF